jgi:hypothetical protein
VTSYGVTQHLQVETTSTGNTKATRSSPPNGHDAEGLALKRSASSCLNLQPFPSVHKLTGQRRRYAHFYLCLVRFTKAVSHEGPWHVARRLEVEVTSQGETADTALANLREALEL